MNKNNKKDEMIGKIFTSNEGCEYKILDYVNAHNIKIVFNDSFAQEKIVNINNIKTGKIKNNYNRTMYGVGYVGVGKYKTKENGKSTKAYCDWRHMLYRVYCEESLNIYPTYRNVTVCDEWHNFQNFCDFYENNFPHHIEGVRLEIDKDLLQLGLDYKVYSPKTVVWLPQKINSFITRKDLKFNKTNSTGVSVTKNGNYSVSIKDFNSNNSISLGTYKTIEEASSVYNKSRIEQSEKAKNYLRSLNYLSEDIIQLIK